MLFHLPFTWIFSLLWGKRNESWAKLSYLPRPQSYRCPWKSSYSEDCGPCQLYCLVIKSLLGSGRLQRPYWRRAMAPYLCTPRAEYLPTNVCWVRFKSPNGLGLPSTKGLHWGYGSRQSSTHLTSLQTMAVGNHCASAHYTVALHALVTMLQLTLHQGLACFCKLTSYANLRGSCYTSSIIIFFIVRTSTQ